jgi:signal transduction histidine kinase
MVLSHPVRKSGATIVRDLPDNLPRARAIKNPCVQVFVNLLRNALEAAGRGGEVRVDAGESDGRVIVSITDSGPGFRPEDLARVFEPFFTTKPAGEGTGLGLAICQTIMKGFAGDIRIEECGGRWCRVTLEFGIIEVPKAAQ